MTSISEADVDGGGLSGKAAMPGFWDTVVVSFRPIPLPSLWGHILQTLTFVFCVGFVISKLEGGKGVSYSPL